MNTMVEKMPQLNIKETTLDRIRNEFAGYLRSFFISAYGQQLTNTGLDSIESFNSSIEKPRKPEFGDLAFPLFPYVKALKVSPSLLYAALITTVADKTLGEISFAGGYVNLKLNTDEFTRASLNEALDDSEEFGSSDVGMNKRVLVEYSSPNIAKPFGIGHLRSTVIGASLHRLFTFLGYDTVGINYLGDWGTQFGKMIAAYKLWDGEKVVAKDAVHGALDLYVRFHQEEENNPDLSEKARQEFKKLEDGDPEAVQLWKRFKEISWAEFERVYNTLGVQYDLITGESELNDKMDAAIERLQKAGLTTTSRGALVVDLEPYGLPPCLLRKQDGATLYATRDIAGLIYRWEKYPFHESLYVVGAAQSDHFKQVYKVIELLEDAENTPPEKRMTGKVAHIPFGWVKFMDKALSTRSGNVIFLEDVLDKAIELASQKIAEKNPDLSDSALVAKQIGVGAIIFTQLSVRRLKDVNFSWEEALSFEGETGPYLQYTHARLCSLIRKYDRPIPDPNEIDVKQLKSDDTRHLLVSIARYPEALRVAAREYEPFIISSYLLELASQFNSFYQQKDENGSIVRIISEDHSATDARMAVVEATRRVVKSGLMLLGIDAPEQM